MKTFIWAPLAVLAAAPHAFAQQVDTSRPDRLVRGTIESVMSAIHSDKAASAGDPDSTYRIVQEKFLPSTDFRLTTQYAAGPAWDKATPAQRDELFKQFQTLLARTYATQLTQISGGQNTQFKFPPMPPVAPAATDAVVRTTVVTGGDTMPIDYRVRKTDGGWRIYDINMMGAWMIQVYRQQFAAQVAKGGVDGLIKFLQAHNQANR
jgi:ABC-type transporter MlaC component